MKQLPIIIILIIANSLFGQEDEFDKYLMVKAIKLSIRAEPDINSPRLGVVEKGELVKILDRRFDDRYMVRIDGIYNSWAKVEYNGIEGYMFGGYLADEEVKIANEKWDGKYLLLMEGNQGGAVFSNDLNWYGVYARKDGEYIERVTIRIEYSIDSIMDDNLKISTDRKEKARILIGTNEDIQLGRVGIPLGRFSDRVIMNDQILPIPIYDLDCSVNTEYLLIASNWKDKKNPCFVEEYTLRFCREQLIGGINYLHEFEGLVEKLGECNIPILVWFGDVNGDEIPDFIFANEAMSYSKYKLFLSKKEEDIITFEKVVEFIPQFTSC